MNNVTAYFSPYIQFTYIFIALQFGEDGDSFSLLKVSRVDPNEASRT